MRLFFTVAVVSWVVAGCAADPPGRQKLADGSYQLTCRKPLADCLAGLTDVCSLHGYDVIRGKEEKNRYGVEPVASEIIESEAIVRCRSAGALVGGESAPPAASHHAAVAPNARCFPGSTQACLGPGACKGAQTCRGDGAMFGPCDCGGASPTPTPPAGDAGPASTWAVPPADDGGTP